jgi:ribose transport system permease protein
MSSHRTALPSTASPRGGRRFTLNAYFLQAIALPLVWILMLAVFAVTEPTKFFTLANIANVLGTQATLAILSLAVLLPLGCGDFDLSAASNAGLVAMVVAVLNVQQHVPIALAVLIGLLTGAVTGFVNGAIILIFKVDAFIATLGVGTVLLGITLGISGQNVIFGVDGSWTSVVDGSWFGISHCFYAVIALTLILWYITQHTISGRRMLFVGLSRTVAQLSGIRVMRIRWIAFVGCGFLAGLCGVAYVGVTGGSDPTSVSSSYLLPAMAAAFLGSTTIVPGQFNAWGITMATYFLASGFTGLELFGVPDWVQQLFYGGILVIAVALAKTEFMARRRRYRSRSAEAEVTTAAEEPLDEAADMSAEAPLADGPAAGLGAAEGERQDKWLD